MNDEGVRSSNSVSTIVAMAALTQEREEELGGYATGPERALLQALLFDGVSCCLSYLQLNSRKRPDLRESYLWIFGAETEYVFSFKNVCDALGLDSSALRNGIMSARPTHSRTQRIRRRT